ncbi:MAG: NAD-dependent epimerase/dehydratase family protein [Bacteroidales bacterium]|nr:NAD-dependent epimerase/dehydratase family protein [Bacteroidales bacterium]MCF8390257.1 NAD-dependent epimerase/dehydratase family protein [Bacteroidales bacterium]
MKIIIIGSKGFIGHHLINHFRRKGNEVWGADVEVDYVNTKDYFLIDSSNSDFASVFQNEKYDLCINCSGAASVPDSLNNPIRDYYLNTVNVFTILEAINKFQSNCRFINLSSAAVYGNPQHLPVKESENPNPISPYGIHKHQAEQICKEFHDFFGIPTCSLRIFSVYGTGQKKQLFWDLYNKVKAGKPFTLFGTGNESRDFINVIDLVRAIELVSEHSDFNGDIVNIANGEEIIIKNAVSIFFSFFKNNISYSFSGDSRKGDPVNWKADIRKLNSFGYQPSVDMKTGLKEYFDWIERM